ncbi:peptidase c14 caspase catalytic subunit p20 [Fusarium langsethiae]|uniref:Peptidase c14 caspase catalytic subunit p20 n=1 Tax=Fusarium langsethiae TaxID=179993 RepID=A0A0N0DC02_FUSLA|nr:peptidase c14 caspase catalytic subunit p20 [Fusarium langsethiae]GKU06563.1 unnamed protein product [Fusarium langsethiae]GKU12012.1 unnamed protein product [Fusarium langsethiae]
MWIKLANLFNDHSSHPVSGNPPIPRELGLLIASPFEGLSGPPDDVASMEVILKTQGFSILQCYGQNATRANILEAWDNLIGSISSADDTVTIYSSGRSGIIDDWEEIGHVIQDESHRYQYVVPMDLKECRSHMTRSQTKTLNQGQGSIYEDTPVCISLDNKGGAELPVSGSFINVKGGIVALFGESTMAGYGSHEFGLGLVWPKDVSKTNPITEHLFFIITDDPVDLGHFETAPPVNELRQSDLLLLEERAFGLVTGTVRKTDQKNSRKGRYDTQHFSAHTVPHGICNSYGL